MKNAPKKIKLKSGKELEREWRKQPLDVCDSCGHYDTSSSYWSVGYIWTATDGTHFREASGSAKTKKGAWEECLRHLNIYHKGWKAI